VRWITGDERVGPLLERADQDGYVEATGERMALLGGADQRLECWMWPLILFDGLEVRARRDGVLEDAGARTVTVVPEGLGLAWEQAGYTLRVEACCAHTERALVLLVSIEGEAAVDVLFTFTPAFRPMWPAGLGGQVSGRDDKTGALYLSEERGRFAALIGSPEADVIDVPAERGIRERLTISLPLSGARAGKGPVPLFIAGAQRTPAPLTEEELRGGRQSATGLSRAELVLADARAAYRALCTSWPALIDTQRARWRSFLARTAHLACDDEALERAFLWSKIAIERCWVTVDGVGRTLVAGLGPAFGGDRPGFGWFFNGDAFAASRALAALGDLEGCRAIFRFAAATQREDGKIAHEITLSADLCDWFEEYPYAYYKGQQTPGFVSCLAHYVLVTGEADLAEELWSSLERALVWCRSTCDDSGCMRVDRAGIAAVEAGHLAGRIVHDVYLQGIWRSALRGALALAERLGRDPGEWGRWSQEAERGMRTFWDAERGRLAALRLADGSLCPDLSAYTALPLARRVHTDAHPVLDQNRPEVMADWGARMFAEGSEVYDPEDYNTGSVFPYLTNFTLLALYVHGEREAAWQVLSSQVELDGFGGLGYLPEFLAGDRAALLPRAVPHQVFSQSTILQGVIFGLLGLDAGVGVGPPPGLRRLRLARVWRAGSPCDVALERRAFEDGREELVACVASETELPPPVFVFHSVGGSSEAELAANRVPVASEARGLGSTLSISARADAPPARRWDALLRHRPAPQLDLARPIERGAASSHPRLVGRSASGGESRWVLAGRAGTHARIPLAGGPPREVEGARLADGTLHVIFPPGTGFTETTVTLHVDP
jgi:hypothetical protein